MSDEKPGRETFDVKVDTFINYKDEQLVQRTEIAGEIQQNVMRIREQQTVEALMLLGWMPPNVIPEFSDEACNTAQTVYNTTPVVFGERARRMRAALTAAMQVHGEEVAKAVAARAAELEAKYAPKAAPETQIMLVSPDGSWLAEVEGEASLEQFRMDHDDHTSIEVPLALSDEALGEVAQLVANGAPQDHIDGVIAHWLGG